MNFVKLLLLILLLVSPSSVQLAQAASYQDAEAAYARQDYQQAFSIWKPLAEAGDKQAQYDLGILYANGLGVARSDQQAVVWFKKSAEQGFAEAQYALGYLYEWSTDIPQSFERAADWYEKAAIQGHVSSMLAFGAMFEEGKGRAQDNGDALFWYQRAANTGDAAGRTKLEKLKNIIAAGGSEESMPEASFADGIAALRNGQPDLGVRILSQAGQAGDLDAQEALGFIYYGGKFGVNRSFEDAAVWFEMAGHGGRADAMNMYGRMLENGEGVSQNLDQASYWYALAAKAGNEDAAHRLYAVRSKLLQPVQKSAPRKKSYGPPAKIELGEPYKLRELSDYLTENYEQSFKTAREHLKQKDHAAFRSEILPYAEAGMAEVQLIIANSYLITKEYYEGVIWLQRAAAAQVDTSNQAQVAEAQSRLGDQYILGEGVLVADQSVAAGWYALAASHEAPNQHAAIQLARMYENGDGIAQSYDKAFKYHKMAAELGDVESQYQLGMRYAEGKGIEQSQGAAMHWLKKAADQGHEAAAQRYRAVGGK